MGGTSCGTALQSGSRVRMFESVSEIVPPAKADRPVNMSNRVQPNAQTSARLSIGLPRACSGLMNAAVPRTIPSAVAPDVSVGDSAIAWAVESV